VASNFWEEEEKFGQPNVALALQSLKTIVQSNHTAQIARF
jgi:hypothetical protein